MSGTGRWTWWHLQPHTKPPEQHKPPNGKEQADQHHSLPLPLPHSGCQESLVLQELLPRACAFRCLLSDIHILASVSVSPTAANRSFLLPSTYPSLTKLLASGNREQLPSVGTFGSNHLTLQSSKPNPFSSCNNLLKGPSRHTAHLYSLTLAPWKHHQNAEVPPVAAASFRAARKAFETAIRSAGKKSPRSGGTHSPQLSTTQNGSKRRGGTGSPREPTARNQEQQWRFY